MCIDIGIITELGAGIRTGAIPDVPLKCGKDVPPGISVLLNLKENIFCPLF
jgi:hypothetical protein